MSQFKMIWGRIFKPWISSFLPHWLGWATLAGLFIGIFQLSGTTGELYWSLAIILVLFLFGMSAYITYPGSRKSAALAIGKRISPGDIDKYYDIDVVLGLIGIEDTGKTTFLEKIARQYHSNVHTETPYAIVESIRINGKSNVVAIIDSVGTSPNNQFQIPKLCNNIILFVDHNSLNDIHIDADRLADHAKFIKEFCKSMTENEYKIQKILFTMNKYDCWRSGDPGRVVRSFELMADYLSKHRFYEKRIDICEHSNFDHDRLVRLLELSIGRGEVGADEKQ